MAVRLLIRVARALRRHGASRYDPESTRRETSGWMDAYDTPFLVLAVAVLAQWLAAYAGDLLRRKLRPLAEDERADFAVVLTAALTLLGLIIGFSFAMAVSRYDQRKNLEEAEANAIGTAYVRADLLPAEPAAKVRDLLRQYLAQRIAFYLARDGGEIRRIGAEIDRLQAALWSTVVHGVSPQQTAVEALVVSGMNDVLNAQGYTQAAWWNRIPVAAWGLMALVAISCNLLFGYGERRGGALALVLPLIVSVSFFLIADIDTPRAGIIRVLPQNLLALAQTMKPQ
jgi:hypothetical protein